jgi:predicted metal-binding membrane protein
MALYLIAFIAPWIAVGAVAIGVAVLIGQLTAEQSRSALVVALIVASAWEMSGPKRRALLQCALTLPLPPVGLRADVACIRFGLYQARRCFTTCWALMAVLLVAGPMPVVWMAGLSVLVVIEHWTTIGWRLRRPTAALLAAIAVAVILR